jgi:hypothetical protein
MTRALALVALGLGPPMGMGSVMHALLETVLGRAKCSVDCIAWSPADIWVLRRRCPAVRLETN